MCGVACGPNPPNNQGLRTCLAASFPVGPPTLTFPGDGDAYFKAKNTFFTEGNFPVAVVYVENTAQVQDALLCAVENGYRVSARGKGHSYQGLSVMSGHLVIDMSRTCKPDEIVVDKNATGDHILEGSKYIGTIKAQSGCTNAIMLYTAHVNFDPSDGAMALIGSCPSVGITGFTLGGGSGDITPYAGYAIDLLTEVEMVLYNGTIVTCSEDENPDLFWATRGGGGGNGVITHLTYKVMQSPAPQDPSSGRKFTFVFITFLTSTEEERKSFLTHFQNYLYETDPKISGKFGGGGFLSSEFHFMKGLYLGSWTDLVEEWIEAKILGNSELADISNASCALRENYEEKNCSEQAILADALPGVTSLAIAEFNTYGEAMASNICTGPWGSDTIWSASSGDFCADLGIENEYCTDGEFLSVPIRVLKYESCFVPEVVTAILNAAGDADGFMNRHGPSDEHVTDIGLAVAAFLNSSLAVPLSNPFGFWDQIKAVYQFGWTLISKSGCRYIE